MSIVLFFDGSSRGNPGKCSIGGFVKKNNEIIYEYSYRLDEKKFKTNNQAEYASLIFGLQFCAKKKFNKIRVYGDSEIVINQLTGINQVKSDKLKFLYDYAIKLIQNFDVVEMGHIYRENNEYADRLAAEAHSKGRFLEWKC